MVTVVGLHRLIAEFEPEIVHAYGWLAFSVAVAYFSAPSPENARTAESYGLHFDPPAPTRERHTKPGEWLEYSPLITLIIVALWTQLFPSLRRVDRLSEVSERSK